MPKQPQTQSNARMQELAGFVLPEPSSLPKIDLYMDQVLAVVNEFLPANALGMTQAMINNYSKNDMIPRPRRKKYARQHVMAILMAHALKQSLCLEDAKLLLSQFDEKDMEEAYNHYRKALTEQLQMTELLTKKISEAPKDPQWLTLALSFAAQAQAGKLMCEALLPLLEEPEEKKRKKESPDAAE